MTEYKREILYMKRVQGGRIFANRSFCRLECKDGDLLLHFSVQEADISPDSAVYLIYQKEGGFFPHQLGTLEENTTCDFCSHIQYLPQGTDFGDICGVLAGDESCYLTGRCKGSHEDILFSQIHFHKTESLSAAQTEGMSAGSTDIPVSEKNTNTGESPKTPGRQNDIDTAAAQTDHSLPESSDSGNESGATPSIPSFLGDFEPVYPFEDNEWEWCLNINPADFTRFPMEYWHYQKNSFLLMGFYNFHHLLYAHKENKNFVGVPGQFCRREQYLAGRFGFSRFKGTKRKRLSAGDFGYWLKEV